MADNNQYPDVSKANFYDQPPEEQEKLISSLESSQKALEQRYANPNWYNVAAGFLKPQLGGFMASLGSANQAMGENLEKQRANELTAAQYRTQVALMKNQLSQNAKGNAKAKLLTGDPNASAGAAADAALTSGQPISEALPTMLTKQAEVRGENLSQTNSARTSAGQIADLGSAITPVVDAEKNKLPALPGATIPSNETSATQKIKIKPPEFLGSQEEWDAKPLSDQNAFNSSLAETNKNVSVSSKQKYQAAAESAQPKIDMLRGMRELASLPGMDKVFGLLKDSDIVSLTAKAASEGRFGSNLSNAENILRQANTPPELISKVAELSKLINQSKISGGVNATDSYRELNGAANPSLDNPQTAFIALTDATAHSAAKDRDLYNMLQGKKPNGEGYNASTFTTEPIYKKYANNFSREHSDILINPVRNVTPKYYSSTISEDAPTQNQKPATNTPAPSRSSPAGWEKQPNGSFKKVE